MATLTVEVDKEKDLPVLEAVLTKMGFRFTIEKEEEWRALSDKRKL